jgi:hypothetical protein
MGGSSEGAETKRLTHCIYWWKHHSKNGAESGDGTRRKSHNRTGASEPLPPVHATADNHMTLIWSVLRNCGMVLGNRRSRRSDALCGAERVAKRPVRFCALAQNLAVLSSSCPRRPAGWGCSGAELAAARVGDGEIGRETGRKERRVATDRGRTQGVGAVIRARTAPRVQDSRRAR